MNGQKILRISLKSVMAIGRILLAILTFGYSERQIWIHRQIRDHGGFRAGLFGAEYVNVADGFVTASGLLRRKRVPVANIASVDRSRLGTVTVENTGKGGIKMSSWHPLRHAEMVEAAL